MRVQEDGRAARGYRPDDRPHLRATERIEGRRRLVEDHEVWRAEQRDGQPETLLHPLRERPDEVATAITEADGLQRPVDVGVATVSREAREVGVKREDLAGPQPRLVSEQLRQVADTSTRRPVAERRAEDRGASARRPREAQE
jgi:hypothetical protein